ncbi:CubicO group peptidase, beta-lactamase class C family [Chitinophaga eiseniae]|uniref:CubicO group peptidase, beta-lactamase class C family n=1 Tax=Chitinophaga eiseniae TaxID=634771 RepID=A0A1T4P6F5_9BACT|nr:serine hydrolase domain-containing protein [Chitinophaga eiseniae]SJZ86508.1 CubicO group peptidase, beta-lactamase class C family [Chitinophaga eiseniae]
MRFKSVFLALIITQMVTLFFNHPSFSQIKTLNGGSISEQQMDKVLKEKMHAFHIPGLSIAFINEGRVVYQRTFGMADLKNGKKVDAQTLFEAASLTKPVFAYFTLRMAEKGVLQLDTPLYKYLPPQDFDYDERYKLITARMVLDHTSGLPNWRSDNQGMEMNIAFTPGTAFSYSGEAYYYLAKVIARLTGTNLVSISHLLQQEVFRPLNMQHAYVVWDNSLQQHMALGYDEKWQQRKLWKPKVFNAASSLLTEAGSYANFLIALMNEKGLSPERFKDMLQQHVALPTDNIIRKHFGYAAWGLGIAMRPSPYGMLYCHGGTNEDFESAFMLSKDLKAGYVFFINTNKGIQMNTAIEQLMVTGIR